MKHKIGDVVLVPMRVESDLGDVNRQDDGLFLVSAEWGRMKFKTTLSAGFLDTCAAAPRVPAVGDTVLFEKHHWEVVAIRGDYGVLWDDDLGSADELLTNLTIVESSS